MGDVNIGLAAIALAIMWHGANPSNPDMKTACGIIGLTVLVLSYWILIYEIIRAVWP